jgi:hypothetical protein
MIAFKRVPPQWQKKNEAPFSSVIEKGIATLPEEHQRLTTALLRRFGRDHGAWI